MNSISRSQSFIGRLLMCSHSRFFPLPCSSLPNSCSNTSSYTAGRSLLKRSQLFQRPDSRLQTFASMPNPSDDPTKVLYDGECRICQIEITALKRFTRGKEHLVEFVDIAEADYDPEKYGGVTYEIAMMEMHVIDPTGKVLTQSDAIRQMYRACGLSWLASFTELPVLKPISDSLYIKFAEYRLRNALKKCDSGSCSVKLQRLREHLEKTQ